MVEPSPYTYPPCWDDEQTAEWLSNLLDRLGLTVEEALEGECNWIYRLHKKISA